MISWARTVVVVLLVGVLLGGCGIGGGVQEVRLERLADELGDHFVGIQIEPRHANPANRPLPPHSVVTNDLIDEPGQPTHEARERVLQLFRDRLQPAPA